MSLRWALGRALNMLLPEDPLTLYILLLPDIVCNMVGFIRVIWVISACRSRSVTEASLGTASNTTDCYLRQGARPLKGTYKGNIFTYFFVFRVHMCPYEPIWACMGTYGPRPGPWRAGKVKKKHFFSHTFSQKSSAFEIQTTIFDGKTMFFKFLAEIRLRTQSDR